MGRSLGISLQAHGHTIFFKSYDRSEYNTNLALSHGFRDVVHYEKLVETCTTIICIGTLDTAFETPKHIFRNGCNFDGLYIDLNSLNGEQEENRWRTLISGLTDNYVEGAIRGYPFDRIQDVKLGSHLMLVSGDKANDVYGLFQNTIWNVQYCESGAKTVNRFMASTNGINQNQPMYQDKTTPKNSHWEWEMLDLVANKYYVGEVTGVEAIINVWKDIQDGKLREVAKELGFPEQLGLIHAINTFGKNLTINHSLDKPRSDKPSWHN